MPLFSGIGRPKFTKQQRHILAIALALITSLILIVAFWFYTRLLNTNQKLNQQQSGLATQVSTLETQLRQTEQELTTIKQEDQFQRNETLQLEIENLQQTYLDTVVAYEKLLRLKIEGAQAQPLEASFAKVLTLISQRNYASASAELNSLNQQITTVQQQQAATAQATIPTTLPQTNDAPASGYRRQAVTTEIGTFQVDIVAADLNTTRVQVETASESDCRDNCPVDSLANFVAKSGGFAGINGPYFCPAEYPSCAGKTNSFDTLLMNKNKVYFNSENNVYSTVPALIFSGSSARFVGQSLDWGRDTSVDAVIASQPTLVSNGEIRFGGDGDPKKGSRGNRSFIGVKDSTVYIGVVRSATVAEVAYVLKALGLQHALNLDSGGSTALYASGRYVAGPGRNTPFGIILVRK